MPFHFESKPALVAYVTCGDPDLATTREVILAAIEAGASIIELGVPFSDPLADGPVIQRASERALKHGTASNTSSNSPPKSASIPNPSAWSSSPISIQSCAWASPSSARWRVSLASMARSSPISRSKNRPEYLREARKNDLATIFLAAPTSTDQRLKKIADVSTGFIYAISRTGVTGERQQMSADARGLVKRIRRFSKLPVAVGFGISTPEQFAAVGKFAEAAVVGSAIVHVIEQNTGREAAVCGRIYRQLTAVSSQLLARKYILVSAAFAVGNESALRFE